MKKPNFVPKGITFRQWKAQKRKQLKDVFKAVSKYQSGCRYCPSYETDINLLFEVIERLKKSHSYKEWG